MRCGGLVLIIVLRGLLSMPAATPEAHIGIQSVSDIAVSIDGTVTASQLIELDERATALLAGSADFSPEAIAGYMRRRLNATASACELRNGDATLALLCSYTYRSDLERTAAGIALQLPSELLAGYTARLSVRYPYAIHIDERTSVRTPGPIVVWDRHEIEQIPVSSRIDRSFRLVTAMELTTHSVTTVALGDGLEFEFALDQSLPLIYTTRYVPMPLKWLLFALTAIAGVYHVMRLTALDPRRPLRSRMRLGPAQRRLALAIVATGLVCVLYALTLRFAPHLIQRAAAFFGQVGSPFPELPLPAWSAPFRAIPRLVFGGFRLTPYQLLLCGGLALGIGLGLLHHEEWARGGLLILAIVAFALVVIAAAPVLLAPALLSAQTVVVFVLAQALLFLLAQLINFLTHPTLRLWYREPR